MSQLIIINLIRSSVTNCDYNLDHVKKLFLVILKKILYDVVD